MKVKVAEGRSVSVDGRVYLGGESFEVDTDHEEEARTWIRLGYAEEIPKRKSVRRGSSSRGKRSGG